MLMIPRFFKFCLTPYSNKLKKNLYILNTSQVLHNFFYFYSFVLKIKIKGNFKITFRKDTCNKLGWKVEGWFSIGLSTVDKPLLALANFFSSAER